MRDLQSLENLAHCDVVCLDKTGTLTEGSLEVERVYQNTDENELRRLMATYLVNTDDNNSTYHALNEHFSRTEPYEVTAATPFSSERKWSSVTLSDGRVLGNRSAGEAVPHDSSESTRANVAGQACPFRRIMPW